jgi:hypothetical protein
MARLSSTRFLVRAVAFATVAALAGCSTRGAGSDPSTSTVAATAESREPPEHPADLVAAPASDAIVAIHRSKCGACHTRVEPGSVSRATAESAMMRHRRRAKLTERQWEEMVDYLSSDGLAHARPTAHTL